MAALRHPFAIKCPAPFESQLPPQSDMFDKGYVLLAAWAGVQQAARNKWVQRADVGACTCLLRMTPTSDASCKQ